MEPAQKYPWESLKKSGDSFIASDYSEITRGKKQYLSNKAKEYGYKVGVFTYPDGRTIVYRK